MEHWNEAKIKDFAEVKGGKRLPKGKQLIKEPNSHPYIRIRDLGKTKYLQLNSEYEYVDDETHQSIARYIVNKGDILISVVGTIGLIGIVGETLDKANQTENCDKIINIKNVLPEYLYYYLISSFGQDEIRKGTVGAVQPKLPLKNVQDITIFYPSIEEQERIVNILSSVDEKIEMNNAINNNLEQQAQAIFKSWFIDLEPFSNRKPSDWSVSTLGNVSIMGAGGDKPQNVSPIKTDLYKYPIYSNGLSNEGLYGFTDKPKIRRKRDCISSWNNRFCVFASYSLCSNRSFNNLDTKNRNHFCKIPLFVVKTASHYWNRNNATTTHSTLFSKDRNTCSLTRNRDTIYNYG